MRPSMLATILILIASLTSIAIILALAWYLLLGPLALASHQPDLATFLFTDQAITPILILITISLVALVIVRQIFISLHNQRLTVRQANTLEQLKLANLRVSDHAQTIVERNVTLELGITHLKDIQARLANGDLRARAHLATGELVPLAHSLNHTADRMMRLGQSEVYLRRLTAALADLSIAFDHYWAGGPLIIPPSCHNFPEINRLLLSIDLKKPPVTQKRQPEDPSPTPPPINGNKLRITHKLPAQSPP